MDTTYWETAKKIFERAKAPPNSYPPFDPYDGLITVCMRVHPEDIAKHHCTSKRDLLRTLVNVGALRRVGRTYFLGEQPT